MCMDSYDSVCLHLVQKPIFQRFIVTTLIISTTAEKGELNIETDLQASVRHFRPSRRLSPQEKLGNSWPNRTHASDMLIPAKPNKQNKQVII